MLELGLVLGVGLGIRHRVNVKCSARCGRRKNRSGRARARCRARTGCTAKAGARGEVVPMRELNAAFRGTSTICVISAWHLPKVLIRKKMRQRLLRR